MPADTKRNYSGGKYAFELDGAVAALVKKVDGLHLKTTKVTTKQSTGLDLATIGGIEVEDMTVEVGLSMGQPLIDWINAALRGEHMRKAGSVIAADADGYARSRRDFVEALITEINFPACDAASKDGTYLTFKAKAENITSGDGDGNKVSGNINTRQKVFLPANFIFEVGSLPCATVSKIGAFSYKQACVVDPVGQARMSQIVPGPITFTELDVTFGMRDYKAWQDWFRDFVVDGNCGQDKELSASISWMSQNMKEELARVDFKQVGILELKENANEAGKEGLKTAQAKLYFEGMEFKVTGA